MHQPSRPRAAARPQWSTDLLQRQHRRFRPPFCPAPTSLKATVKHRHSPRDVVTVDNVLIYHVCLSSGNGTTSQKFRSHCKTGIYGPGRLIPGIYSPMRLILGDCRKTPPNSFSLIHLDEDCVVSTSNVVAETVLASGTENIVKT